MMQQQIEFEAIPFQHTVRIPDYIPDGVSVRVILSFDDAIMKKNRSSNHWKNLLGSMPNVGKDEDFERPLDYGREIAWDS
jgi:hypothetical protein